MARCEVHGCACVHACVYVACVHVRVCASDSAACFALPGAPKAAACMVWLCEHGVALRAWCGSACMVWLCMRGVAQRAWCGSACVVRMCMRGVALHARFGSACARPPAARCARELCLWCAPCYKAQWKGQENWRSERCVGSVSLYYYYYYSQCIPFTNSGERGTSAMCWRCLTP